MKRIVLFLGLYFSVSGNMVQAQEQLVIDAAQRADTAVKHMQGFLHGGAAFLDSVAVARLRPQFWRLGAYSNAGSAYDDIIRFNPKTTVVLNDLYMILNNIPSQTQSQPWVNNWQLWDQTVDWVVTLSLSTTSPVDYWDVWGEPDNFWTGTSQQFIEMYRRTDSIVHSIIPNAKITGPEFAFGSCNFDVAPVLWFLDTLHANNSGVSSVSWHEFCNPHDVPGHISQLRDSIAVRPWLANLKIHIPEYGGPLNHTIPGWNVGWLRYFEEAKADWVSHACWNESDGVNSWSDCEFGLNGLFMQDGVTTQPNYWVHRAYAELDTFRLVTSGSHTQTVALASRNDLTQEIKIIAGRYDNPNLGSHNAPATVNITIRNYPYGNNATVPYTIQRIPSNNVAYAVPLPAPVHVISGSLTFTGDSVTIPLPNFIDGDACLVYINPMPGTLLGAQEVAVKAPALTVFPNPVASELQLQYIAQQEPVQPVRIYNMHGEVVFEKRLQPGAQLQVKTWPAGVYTVLLPGYAPQRFVKY